MKRSFLTLVALSMTLSARAQESGKRQFPAKGINTLEIQTESGDIQVHAGNKIISEVIPGTHPEYCRLTMETRGDKVFLKAERTDKLIFSVFREEGCGDGFRVSMPAALSLGVKTASGNVSLDAITGDASLATASGNISGSLSGTMNAKTASGSLALKRLTSGARVTSASGAVRLAWAKAPTEPVSIHSASGDVVLTFPAGTKLQSRQITASGNATNKLDQTPDAPLKVFIQTASGDSTIRAGD